MRDQLRNASYLLPRAGSLLLFSMLVPRRARLVGGSLLYWVAIGSETQWIDQAVHRVGILARAASGHDADTDKACEVPLSVDTSIGRVRGSE